MCKFQEVRTSKTKLGHWGCALEGDTLCFPAALEWVISSDIWCTVIYTSKTTINYIKMFIRHRLSPKIFTSWESFIAAYSQRQLKRFFPWDFFPSVQLSWPSEIIEAIVQGGLNPIWVSSILMLIFQACRMQELWGFRNFHQDVSKDLKDQAVFIGIREPESNARWYLRKLWKRK